MQKRAVSDVVATVIIVALVIVAITVVWIGVMPLIRDKIGSSDVCNDVDISIESGQGYTCWASDKNVTLVQVKKGPNDVNISKLKFSISSGGNSISYVNNSVLSKNSYGVYYLNTTGVSGVDKIEVAPYVKNNNAEQTCSNIYLDNVKPCSPTVLTISEVAQVIASGDLINKYSVPGPTAQEVPIINLFSPSSTIYTTNLVWLNVSSNKEVSWKYSLNGAANVSFVPNISLTLANGNYNLVIYANSSNNFNSTTTSFSVNVPCSTMNAQGFFNGTGTFADPYGICNCTMLQSMRNYLIANYALLNNINCSMTSSWNGGAGFVPVGDNSGANTYFGGNISGNGYIITNLTINRPTESSVGLIGYWSPGAFGIISNIGLAGVNITAYSYAGALVGTAADGVVKYAYSTGVVNGSRFNTGGLIGIISSSVTLLDVYSFANVTNGFMGSGGLVGFQNGGTINRSYSTGFVAGVSNVGGFLGSQGSSARSYYCYYDNQTSGRSSSAGAVGKTTNDMKALGTFSGNWDFTNVWAINPAKNNGYPYLRWQNL